MEFPLPTPLNLILLYHLYRANQLLGSYSSRTFCMHLATHIALENIVSSGNMS